MQDIFGDFNVTVRCFCCQWVAGKGGFWWNWHGTSYDSWETEAITEARIWKSGWSSILVYMHDGNEWSFAQSFVHLYIQNIYIAAFSGTYSEALTVGFVEIETVISNDGIIRKLSLNFFEQLNFDALAIYCFLLMKNFLWQ